MVFHLETGVTGHLQPRPQVIAGHVALISSSQIAGLITTAKPARTT